MITKNRAVALIMIAAIVLLSSCFFSSGMSREECQEDFIDKHEQRIVAHLNDNIDVFEKVAGTINAYVENADDIDSYRTISLAYRTIKNENDENVSGYSIFTARQPDSDDVIREYTEFIDNGDINIFKLTKDELDMVFPDFDYNSGVAGYKEAYSDSLAYAQYRGNSVAFVYHYEEMYNKADRVDAVLYYSESIVPEDTKHRINDHWYIVYSVYWSPAI